MTASESDFDGRAAELGVLAYRVGFRILGDREEARDVTQETLARPLPAGRVWGPTTRRGSPEWPPTWLWTRPAPGSRPAPRRVARVRRAVGPGAAPVDLAATIVARRELVAVLRRLSRRQREVVVMRYLADLPEGEVAAALGCSVGTVKQHASRGLAALRAALEDPTSSPPSPAAAGSPSADPSCASARGPVAPEGAPS